jgi:hypothetical protein
MENGNNLIRMLVEDLLASEVMFFYFKIGVYWLLSEHD